MGNALATPAAVLLPSPTRPSFQQVSKPVREAFVSPLMLNYLLAIREREIIGGLFDSFAARWINPEAPLPYPSGLRLM